MVASLPLLSCESSVSVKENPDRNNNNNNNNKKQINRWIYRVSRFLLIMYIIDILRRSLKAALFAF